LGSIHDNSIVIKVHNGTHRSDTDLCATCRHAHRFTGALTGRERGFCDFPSTMIELKEPVAECTAFKDRNAVTLSAMEDIAWTLMTDRGGKTIGFKAPKREEEKKAGF
jgi:hypothetical protein